jgi:hypothetical protein
MAQTPEQISAAAQRGSFSQFPDKWAAILYLLNQQLTTPMTAEQIAAGSACFQCIPDKLAAVLYLLDNASSGGGGSTQLVTYTSGSPAAPTNTSQPAIAYDPTGNLPTLGWNTSNSTWN